MNHTITPAELKRLTNVTARLGPWALPVVNALRQGHIGVTLLQRRERAPLADMRRSRLPVFCWLGDDNEVSSGPDGWRPALPAIRWAKSVLIHAAAGEPDHYQAAVTAAMVTGRLLLIETASRHVPAWLAAVAGKPTLLICPREGSHPVSSQPETRH